MKNSINWFEIPVQDLDRSIRFYEGALDVHLKREVFAGTPMATFDYEDTGVGGALVQDRRRKPSADGTLVYLNAAGRLDEVLARTPAAGGEVIVPRTDIGPPGYIAVVRDTEGNFVGLHAPR